MADDKHKNEDPEEENDNQFDDDEDFGLPDLEYDELDDEDEDSDIDEEEPDFEDPEPELEPEPEPDTEPVPSDTSTEVVGEDELDEDIDVNVEDVDDSETEDWEKELEKELEEELKAEEAGGFYEEESYEDFESTGEDEAIKDSVFGGDDTDVNEFENSTVENGSEYTEKAAATSATRNYGGAGTGGSSYTANYSDDGSKGKFARTVVIGTLAFAIIAVVLFVLWDGEKSEPEKPIVKKEEKTPPPQKPVEQKPEPVEQKPAQTQPKEPQPNTVTPGEITRLDQQTGKSYIVIGSFFDDDMANDYARKLADEGKSPMVIPPFKDYRFYRVAIAEFNNFKDAQASIEGYKDEYGQEVWPLRY